jgi:hypothetical protein
MIDETRARFLAAIATQLDVERVAEVHLFPAIRQGGMESGVAVLALDLATEPVVTIDAAADETHAEAEAETVVVGEELDEADGAEGPYATEADAIEVSEELDELDALLDFDERDGRAEPSESTAPAPRRAPRRFTVYTARYRHTLKGPDRGKWEVSVTEEADAPLLTVDAVVRGVQRRSGEVDEIVRLTGDEMRASLPVVAGKGS